MNTVVKKELKFSDLGIAGKDDTHAQKAARLGVPLIPRRSNVPQLHNPVLAVCGECGHEFRGGLEYRSCPLQNCPTGSRVTLN